ncbi:glycerol-3-phosphate acyltransferase 3-like isoform X1 [Amphibalanus amphitrite]|uniref:glycerol-3-phosphate acyltransferase 3-like isoform X1 n=1 Tax=Amphibalanus amphitrite TaxID=1232801 RepID=UPI001C91FD54|nr:glycerol-3-phosphate acyltransferase 3-like isoform X1 [Amphibalanus amphitrite]XP_043215707.1 glycerol-3-phosphate acyltransferase 3-like isoform X1 [Amphibalanus amphitrite]XP_043215709.1 glycerol-3-phosphate acyltransferase 3-like isoform X1 [Amphibalanus amphitrite]XP_043215710.1 glycerol-3-phosphate acyltransferase 3-like isoform X1 [Amphibalanus amphitrite]XP_043215711.1 glycerol-3-phosphate acyltransferase 3-like isoform X1 [Amphibalanus amphitrite]XP_043215712.1 glycerol-3-phosphate
MVPVLAMLLNGVLLFLVPPLLILYTTLMILAPFGLSLGVRKKYVQLLIKIFEFGRVRLEQKRNRKNQMSGDGHHDQDEDEEMDDKLLLVPDPDSEKKARENGRRILRMGSVCEAEPKDLVSFQLDSCLDYIKSGIQAIVDDEVTKRFCAEELKSWNMLTRTQQNYEFISWRLTFLWFVGFFFRYFFLLPVRITIFFTSVSTFVFVVSSVALVPECAAKRWIYNKVSLMAFRILTRSYSGTIRFHQLENRPRPQGVCVANHTSPIDVCILSCDVSYALIGQRHSGFLGLLQRALTRASSHIWFERGETKDRSAVTRRLKEHVDDPNKLPILIFPEGTCINNTSVMQFKKGSFEVGGTIYPVAIRYDHRFGDAFWNSSQYSMLHYLFMMMTSWAIVCDVWYLPPTTRQPNESAIDFANRVKASIASAGGLVDLMWDGQLKRMSVKQEWREKQQQHFTRRMLAINKEIRDDEQREKDE